MKTINTLASSFILFALSVSSLATDNSKSLPKSIEENNKDILFVLIQHGRNKNLENEQDQTDLQITVAPNNEATLKLILPKGRNAETTNTMISMN